MSGRLHLTLRVLSCPKAGSSQSEYEDAARGNDELGRFAIADGATESSYSGEWARHLTSLFVEDPPQSSQERHLAPWIRKAQDTFTVGLRDTAPWYAIEKARLGAWATFLAFKINVDSRYWVAWAVGDTCLFRCDLLKTALSLAFPIGHPDDFGSSPALVGSKPISNRYVLSKVSRQWGRARSGTSFVLASDALAAWILTDVRNHGRQWLTLLTIEEYEFPAFVESLRRNSSLKNDDTTAMIIEVT